MWRLDKSLDTLVAHGERVIADAKTRWRGVSRHVRWSAIGMDEGKLETLKGLAASGARLERLTHDPAWADVLAAKAYYQELAERQVRNPAVTHEQRFQAACELAAVDGFLVELAARIKRGREAGEKLKELTQ